MVEFNVQSKMIQDIHLVEVSGDLDNETYMKLETKIKETIKSNSLKVLIDLTKVYGFCSAAECVLVWANNALEEKGGTLALSCGNVNVRDLMHAFGMDKVLNLFESREKAIEFLNLK